MTYINTTAHVIEVLTEKATNAYKDFLRRCGISYIIAGKDSLNYELALTKLKEQFGVETLMLGGGAAPDSWFSHVAVEVLGTETKNEWCEPVSDKDYR